MFVTSFIYAFKIIQLIEFINNNKNKTNNNNK